MIQLLRMQKRPSFSATKEEICDVQNEPILQKLFEDAKEVLRLAGAYEKDTLSVEFSSSEVSHQGVEQGLRQDKKQLEKNNGKQVKKPAAITKSKRRKLERVKAPVTILRKMKQVEAPSEEEQEGAVLRMLNYIHQMPSQPRFQPPALPCVSFTMDEADVKNVRIPPTMIQTPLKASMTTLTYQMKKTLLCGRCWLPHQPTAMFLWEAWTMV